MKGPLGNAVLLLASLGFALALAEVLLRVFGVSHPVFARVDPVVGVAHVPGARGWYTVEGRNYVRINASGWRGTDRPLQKPAGVVRIAILGDSYTEAFQVPDDSAFPAILERNLNRSEPGRYEVLNFGLSGVGTGIELLVLQHRALAYAPDVVILAFTTINDVSDNSRALKQVDFLPYFNVVDRHLELDTSFRTSRGFRSAGTWRARVLEFLGQHSRVAQLVRAARLGPPKVPEEPQGARAGPVALELGTSVYRNPPPDSTWAAAWTVTDSLVARINAECRSRHIAFYVVTLSNPAQVTPDTARRRALAAELGVPDLFEPERRLQRLGAQQGFDVLALAPLLASQASTTHEYYHGFGENLGRKHWNERGHRAAAMLLTPWLAERLRRDLPALAPAAEEDR